MAALTTGALRCCPAASARSRTEAGASRECWLQPAPDTGRMTAVVNPWADYQPVAQMPWLNCLNTRLLRALPALEFTRIISAICARLDGIEGAQAREARSFGAIPLKEVGQPATRTKCRRLLQVPARPFSTSSSDMLCASPSPFSSANPPTTRTRQICPAVLAASFSWIGSLIGVTCHHVLEGYRRKRRLGPAVFQLGPIRLDPEAHLLSEKPFSQSCYVRRHGAPRCRSQRRRQSAVHRAATIDEHEFSPNIAFELGYMRALNRQCVILKETRLKSLPSDLCAEAYKEFDCMNISDTIFPRWPTG